MDLRSLAALRSSRIKAIADWYAAATTRYIEHTIQSVSAQRSKVQGGCRAKVGDAGAGCRPHMAVPSTALCLAVVTASPP